MRYLLLYCLFLGGCSKKFIQKTQEIGASASPGEKIDVLYITDESQKYDIYGPLLWFTIIVTSVMLLAISSMFYKK